MIIGVPKEIKNNEYRIGMTPAGVRELVQRGHTVLVQSNGGYEIGLHDDRYQAAGATLVAEPEAIYRRADLIVKVKEPQPNECKMLRPGQTVFTYLHLAPDREQTRMLVDSGCTAIAYETVTDRNGHLPLLAPMSEVAGRMAVQAGAHSLELSQGGNGTLLGGVPGVPPANVVVIGGGVVGVNAARMAMGMEANVTVLDRSLTRLAELDTLFGRRMNTVYSTADAIEEYVDMADLVIGAVLIPGANAPKLVTEAMVKGMKHRAVIVDVAIDQGGCCETSRPTTHADPTYVVHDVVHYCVANMPGAVGRTSTFALTNATLPFIHELAAKGAIQALRDNPHLRAGLNVHAGQVTYEAVARAHGYDHVEAEAALGA